MSQIIRDFIFKNLEDAKKVREELLEIVKNKGYTTYADFYRLLRVDKTEELPEFYYKRGWTANLECQVKPYGDGWVLYMTKIRNIENKINMIKESKDNNERTINKCG